MSLRKAVDAHCKACIYDRAAGGTWREQVAQCSARACDLWPHRPAPRTGAFADPPRNPETVPQAWIRAHQGSAVSALGHPLALN